MEGIPQTLLEGGIVGTRLILSGFVSESKAAIKNV